MKWIGQNIYDSLALFRGNIRVGGGNVYGGDGSSNNWISIDCQNGTDVTGGGITFAETSGGTIQTPQYGAKIVYNEDDDHFSLGTIHNSSYLKQIYMVRGDDNLYLGNQVRVVG